MGISNVISLLGGVALFLFGMTLMGDGLKKVAGSQMETVLYRLAGTPMKGLLLGTAVTAVIQSSCATSVMVVGFVNSGMMALHQAVAVIQGAIIGTSITGWIISLSYIEGSSSGLLSLFSTTTLTGIVAVVGIYFRMFSKKQAHHNVGDILLGFAVLMFGMHSMSDAVSPLKESEGFISMLTAFSNPFLGILVGAGFTAILQSASAAIGILQALSATGAMSFAAAYPIILGIAVGASVPVLISSIGAKADAKRTASLYLIIEVFAAAICAAVYYIFAAIVPGTAAGINAWIVDPFSVAAINSIFRIVAAAILMPFNGIIEKISISLIKVSAQEKEANASFDRLDERFLAQPSVAIEQSRLTINDMALTAQKNINDALDIIVDEFNADTARSIVHYEDILDEYEDKLGTYLMKINSHELGRKQNEDASKYLHTLSDFERIGDHSNNLCEVAEEIHEKKVQFSPEAAHEMKVLSEAIREMLEISIGAFISNSKEEAYKVEPLEACIDDLCDVMKHNHVERLKRGYGDLNQGFVFNDYLTNCERVADHCSNIAIAVIEVSQDDFDTHDYLINLQNAHMNHFNDYFKVFNEKYKI